MRTTSSHRRAGWLALALALAGCGGADVDRRAEGLRALRCPEAARLDDATLARLHPDALRSVEAILRSEGDRECWLAAVKALGHLEGPQAVTDLRAFIEQGHPDLALAENRPLVQEVFFSLARHARRDPDGPGGREALRYLVESTDPAAWEKRGIHWQLDAVTRRELIRDLAGSAVVALTELTVRRGDPDPSITARQHLTDMALAAADRRAFSLKYLTVEDANGDLAELFNLHILPPGRVMYAIDELLARLGDEDAELRTLALRVHERAQAVWDEERRWVRLRRGESKGDQQVEAADRIADQRLSGLHGQLDGLDRLLDGPADQAAIDTVFEVMFPNSPDRAPAIAARAPAAADDAAETRPAPPAPRRPGTLDEGGIQGLIKLPPAQQVSRVLAAIERLRRDHADALTRLKLAPHIEIVEQAHLDLRRALEAHGRDAGSDALLEARSALQSALRVLVATIVAHYPGARPDDAARRLELLGPILVQNERIDDYYRGRLRVRDVDPATGRELAPLEEGGGPTVPADTLAPAARRGLP